jgi:hypothetical protein
VRYLLAATLSLPPLLATVARAQSPWRPAIGIQGGFVHVKPTGTGVPDQTNLWDAPGDGSTYPTVFAVIPLTKRLAVESSLSAAQQSFGGAANTVTAFASSSRMLVTLRGNVAVVAGLYVAAGGMLRYLESDTDHSERVGVLAAVGYRMTVGGGVSARIEAQGVSLPRTEGLVPVNLYALLLGVATHSGASSPAAQGAHPARGPWRLAFGATGGYTRNHSRGSIGGLPVRAEQTLIALPGSAAATPTTLYTIVPVAGRVALEVGVDAHRSANSDSATFTSQVAPRIDVALDDGWYASAGGNLRYVEATGAKGFALAGASVAAGYRFPLTPRLGGRVELSYTVFKERKSFPLAQNIVAVMFGVTVPVR